MYHSFLKKVKDYHWGLFTHFVQPEKSIWRGEIYIHEIVSKILNSEQLKMIIKFAIYQTVKDIVLNNCIMTFGLIISYTKFYSLIHRSQFLSTWTHMALLRKSKITNFGKLWFKIDILEDCFDAGSSLCLLLLFIYLFIFEIFFDFHG